MHSISVSPCQVGHCCVSDLEQFRRLVFANSKKPISACLKRRSLFTDTHFPTLTATNSCSSDQEWRKNESTSYAYDQRPFSEELCSSSDDGYAVNQAGTRRSEEGEEEAESEAKDCAIVPTNMWWTDIKAAMGQRINLEGIVNAITVVAKDRHLALPHVAVQDIRCIDWAYLKSKGFRGVIFDKDNTITAPYSLKLWEPLALSVNRCKSVFRDDIAVFSNSAGLYEFDPNGREARTLEGSIGITVIRHRVKKPAGTAEEIEKHFGCESTQLIMIGDRPFTDIVYGNQNGFLTILTEPLSLAEEPFIVKQVRKLEIALVNRWSRRGLKPLSHRLLPDARQCVKDLPPV